MTFRRIAVTAGVLALSVALGYRAGIGAPPAGESKQTSTNERYAKARLREAELRLQKVQDLNRKVAGTISNALIAQFGDDVEVAKSQLRSVAEAGSSDPFKDWLTRSEVALRAAEMRLKRAMRANQISPGAVDPLDMERLRVRTEVAQLRLEQGRSLIDGSPDARLQWQLEMLNDGLAHVQEQTALISQNRLPEF
jgi:hypothetical protein